MDNKPVIIDLNETSKGEVSRLRNEIVALKNTASGTYNIDDLMEIRENLDSIAFTMQETQSGYYAGVLNATEAIKVYERRIIERETSVGLAFNRAETKAKLETSELRNALREVEIAYEDVKGLRFTLKDYLDGLRQRIAHLRKEEEISRVRETMNP